MGCISEKCMEQRPSYLSSPLIRNCSFAKDTYDPQKACPALTAKEKRLLRESWIHFGYSNVYLLENVAKIFYRTFLLEPELLNAFNAFAGVHVKCNHEGDLLLHDIMRTHLLLFSNALSRLFVSLEEGCFLEIVSTGRRHFTYAAHPRYLGSFCKAFLSVVESTLKTSAEVEVMKAWGSFLALLANSFATGYYLAETAA